MKWNEIKKWASDHGYSIHKDKDNGGYYWRKSDDPSAAGSNRVSSISELAQDVFNDLTSYVWVEYQSNYKEVSDGQN